MGRACKIVAGRMIIFQGEGCDSLCIIAGGPPCSFGSTDAYGRAIKEGALAVPSAGGVRLSHVRNQLVNVKILPHLCRWATTHEQPFALSLPNTKHGAAAAPLVRPRRAQPAQHAQGSACCWRIFGQLGRSWPQGQWPRTHPASRLKSPDQSAPRNCAVHCRYGGVDPRHAIYDEGPVAARCAPAAWWRVVGCGRAGGP